MNKRDKEMSVTYGLKEFESSIVPIIGARKRKELRRSIPSEYNIFRQVGHSFSNIAWFEV